MLINAPASIRKVCGAYSSYSPQPNFVAEFQKRRGYSPLPRMPVLTGQAVQSAEASDNFLFDYRKTLSDLVADYHYDALTTLLAARGMKRYTESHEVRRAKSGAAATPT